jgi:hypothetical protein
MNSLLAARRGFFMKQSHSNFRAVLYCAIAFLTPVGAALEAEQANWPAVVVGATVAALVALRAYIDQSASQVEIMPPEDAA